MVAWLTLPVPDRSMGSTCKPAAQLEMRSSGAQSQRECELRLTDLQVNHIQAVVEILSKQALMNQGEERARTCCDDLPGRGPIAGVVQEIEHLALLLVT